MGLSWYLSRYQTNWAWPSPFWVFSSHSDLIKPVLLSRHFSKKSTSRPRPWCQGLEIETLAKWIRVLRAWSQDHHTAVRLSYMVNGYARLWQHCCVLLTGCCVALDSVSCCVCHVRCYVSPRSWCWMRLRQRSTWRQTTSSSLLYAPSLPTAQSSPLLTDLTPSWTMTGTGNVMIFKQFVECIRLITQSHEALLAGGIIRFFWYQHLLFYLQNSFGKWICCKRWLL